MLSVNNLNVYYGDSHVLRNLLRSLVGMLPARSGSITLAGRELTASKSYERVAAGVGFVPQGRMIFPYLTVEENILTGMQGAPAAPIPDYIYEYFPVLFEMRRRKGGNLSGGQQQQLAIASRRSSRTSPGP
jgi:urea transport system ATP-binding protein